MAQTVQILLIDDVDGGEASETISFALDGAAYEIDLSETHAAELRNSFALWVANARRISARAGGRSSKRGPARTDRAQLQDMRRWARENGHRVSERGRVPQEIQQAYQEAHKAG